MKKGNSKHQISNLMALLLFGVFAVCVLSVLLMGASAYQRLTQRDQDFYDRRTSMQYIATRVRQGDCLDGVTIEDFYGSDCLSIFQQVELDEFITRVYFYDGYIRELYTYADEQLSPDAGEPIMEAQDLSFSLSDNLLTITVIDASGVENVLVLSLRSGEGALS